MEATDKHYKFINSKTGNVIYHYTIKGEHSEDAVKIELEKSKPGGGKGTVIFKVSVFIVSPSFIFPYPDWEISFTWSTPT